MRYRAAFGLVAVALLAGCEQGLSDRELAARIEKSRPAWESYQEDIKGQIGAGPVAEWDGTPSRLWFDRDAVFFTFAMRGPWAARDMGVPVLLRDPSGRVQRDLRADRNGLMVCYTFERPKLDALPTWLEIRYPHTERRLVLSARGEWNER
ncbi:MAG: hypothetical protein NTU83_09580 [Candidatus Hydrogenedentes bacterium]|nr:hypothetical protein [Candidatus Hydrogenedentota bacterium]